jgi:hypothetical protein
MYVVLIAITALISVPYLLPADASIEMKYVPFWWSTDPLTGEAVYTDYFNEVSSVKMEHKAYLASIAKEPTSIIGINPSVLLEAERSSMIEVITYEYQFIKVKDSLLEHGLYANPDYVNRELVAISTWVPAPVVEVEVVVVEDVPVDVTVDVTPETVTEITVDVTPVHIEPHRVSTFDGSTHWDVEEATMSGHDYMSSQQIKDHKLKLAEWRAYETLSKMYPSQYPPYVHEEVVEEVHTESRIIVPVDVQQPRIITSEIVVPMPEPIPEPVPEPFPQSTVPGIPVLPNVTIDNDLIVVPLN